MKLLDFSRPENRCIDGILQQQARESADSIFLWTQEQAFSFAETLSKARRYAVSLSRLGVRREDSVCLFLDPCPEYVFASFACTLLGARWVPVNTDYRGSWLEETIRDSRPVALITDTKHRGFLDEMNPGDFALITKGGDRLTTEGLDAADATGFTPVTGHYGDTLAILWTSGTTGRAKGVMQSHNNWVRAAISSIEMGQYRDGDVTYCCLPLYNSAAWVACIFPALLSGTTVAIDPAFSASDFWNRIRRYRATHTFTLGAMHIFLWNAPVTERDADNSLRSASMVPMPDAIHGPFRERFGLQAIHQGFGQSEIMYLTRRVDDGRRVYPPGGLGEPAEDVEVSLRDDNNRPVAPGEVGEICVRGRQPHVLFNGYFNDAAANEAAFEGGWYHTGDLAKQDHEGHYHFVDRKKDVIRYKGRNVSSVSVEAVARTHPAIREVAVYGVPSDELDTEHEIMLAAVLNPGQTPAPAEVAGFINDRAPYFFVPRYIEFVESLPMTPTQKIRKVDLRQRGVTDKTWDARRAGFEVVR